MGGVWGFPSQANLNQQIEKNNPVKAVEFIRNAKLTGNMLNDYTWGGYLVWTLPEHKVFLDGRADVYEWAGVLAQFGRWAMGQEDPQILLKKYDIAFCLLDARSPLVHDVAALPGWKQVYGDGQAVVLARVAPKL